MTTVSYQSPSAKNKFGAVPLDLWPEADRKAWNDACQPCVRLRRGGAAGHLKSPTRYQHERGYCRFLGFLDRSGLLRADLPAAGNVSADNVEAYVAELKGRVASTTVHDSICKLRRAAQFMAPRRDFTWLAELAKDLKLVARPRSKSDRLALAEVLAEAGLTLMREADDYPNLGELARARQFRNGLMIALLAFCPNRRRNFATLEIGRSFVENNGQWWIVLSASETKEKRADERPVEKLLTPFIHRYLDYYRPLLARSNSPPSALWLSANDGAPIAEGQVTRVIGNTTLSTVGVRVTPHLFRTSAASTAAVYCGENPHLGSAVLHHTDPCVTMEHYNRATSLSAAESFRQIVRQYEKRHV
jgi:integrase